MGLGKAALHRKRVLLRFQTMQETAMMCKKGAENLRIRQSQKPAMLPEQSRRPARQLEMHLMQLLF